MVSEVLSRRSHTIALGLLVFVVAMPALAIGGTRSDTQLAIASLVVLTALANIYGRWGRLKDIPWPAWFFMALAVLTACQAIPIPIEWLQWLSPQSAALHLGYDDARTYAPISVAPIATYQAAIFHGTIALVIALSAAYGRRSGRSISRVIVYVGGVSAIIALTHTFFGLTKIYGIYEAVHRSNLYGMVGPFVNENTQAGLLNLSALTAFGMLTDDRSKHPTKLVLVSAMLCVTTVALGDSRGAQIALLVGWVFFGLMSLTTQNTQSETRKNGVRHVLFVGSLLVMLASVVIFIRGYSLPEFLGAPDRALKFVPLESLSVWAHDYPLMGSGRGSFAAVYPHYQPFDVAGTVSHPENIVVQYLTEWGPIFGSMALIGWGVIIGGSIKIRMRSFAPRSWGLLAGVVAVFIQQFVDFGLESLGLFVPVAAAIGVLYCGKLRDQTRHSLYFWALGIPALIVSLLGWGPKILEHQHDAELERQIQSTTDPDALHAIGQRIALQHPADYYVATAIARGLGKSTPFPRQTFLQWANHAMRLFPNGGSIHYVVGQTLAANGLLAQAAGEYRRAFEKQPWRQNIFAADILKTFANSPFLLDAFGSSDNGRRMMFEGLFKRRQYSAVVRLCDEILMWSPDHIMTHIYRSRAYIKLNKLELLKSEIAWFSSHGHPLEASAFQAQAFALQGNASEAKRVIGEGLSLGGDKDRHYLRRIIRAYQSLGDVTAARKVLDLFWNASKTDTDALHQALVLRASVERRIGDQTEALAALDRAQLAKPTAAVAAQAIRLTLALKGKKAAMTRLKQSRKIWPRSGALRTLARTLDDDDSNADPQSKTTKD